MTDAPQNLPAVRQERALVADMVPVFDTARFEHYGRIAAVMARSSLVPATLREGDGVANCFQVVELADRWGMSPFAVGQAASVVFGKLMLEGKLVAAVLEAKLGLELHHYYTGEWGTDGYRIFVTDTKLDESQIEELRPHIKIPNVKIIDGSVGEWKTFEKDKRTTNGAWLKQPDMQLQYRGDRTWARAFKSAIMLGVLTDDEMEGYEERRLVAPAPEQVSLTAGFTGAPPKKPPQAAAKPETSQRADEPEEGLHASQDAAVDAEFTEGGAEDDDEGLSAASVAQDKLDIESWDSFGTAVGTIGFRRIGSTTIDPKKESHPGEGWEPVYGDIDTREVIGSGTHAEALAEAKARAEAQKVIPQDEPTPSDTSQGSTATSPTEEPRDEPSKTASPGPASSTAKPARDEVYLLAGDEYVDEKRATYKNGVGWSRIGERGAAKLKEYSRHAAEDDAQEEPASEVVEKADTSTVGDDDALIAIINGMTSFLGAKQAAKSLGEAIYAPTNEEVRNAIWEHYVEINDEMPIQTDYLLMWLFIEFGAQRPADIDARWPSFWKDSAYKMAPEAAKARIVDLMTRRKTEMA